MVRKWFFTLLRALLFFVMSTCAILAASLVLDMYSRFSSWDMFPLPFNIDPSAPNIVCSVGFVKSWIWNPPRRQWRTNCSWTMPFQEVTSNDPPRKAILSFGLSPSAIVLKNSRNVERYSFLTFFDMLCPDWIDNSIIRSWISNTKSSYGDPAPPRDRRYYDKDYYRRSSPPRYRGGRSRSRSRSRPRYDRRSRSPRGRDYHDDCNAIWRYWKSMNMHVRGLQEWHQITYDAQTKWDLKLDLQMFESSMSEGYEPQNLQTETATFADVVSEDLKVQYSAR